MAKINELPIEIHPSSQSIPLKTDAERGIVDVARGGGISLLGNAGTKAVTYIYNFALIWQLGAERFGQFTLAMTIVSFIGLVSNIGLPQGIIRYGAIRMLEKGRSGVYHVVESALKVIIPICVLAAIALAFGAEGLSTLVFKKPELTAAFQVLAISIPFVALQSTFLAATRSMKEMKYTSIVGVIQPLIALVLAIILIALGMDVMGAAIAFNTSYVVGSILALIFYLRMIPSEERSGERFPLGQMLKFSIPLSMTEWMQYANERTEIFFLGLLPGAIGISIYKIAWSLAGLETLLRLSLEQILAPYSSDLTHRREITQLGSLYKITAKWGFTAALMIFLIYVLFGKEIMGFFDPSLVSGAWVLVALGAAQLFNEFTGACNTILIMSGRSWLTLMNTIGLFGLNIALDWTLIPAYGLVGAAIAGSTSVILLNMMRVIEVWLILKIHPWKWSFFKPALAGVIAAGGIYLLNRYVMPESLVLDLIAILVFCVAFLWLIKILRVDKDDSLVINEMLHKVNLMIHSKVKPAV